ncbi:hypothetical protein GCM10023206_02410 [Acinetobacter puyangensis]|uniref:Uncharacterized protein n=1 Tax=Acinetobacter puyangensis TaxID=1096779 RepID=A0A240E6L3_9GAMM|nr:hypothetical protein [Acinetobacter puyangensis]SNX44408.1 hypothetical protein SAMN05421731_103146 [Acinetobacter puyangensis]
MSKIYYFPEGTQTNAYCKRMQDLLSNYGEICKVEKSEFIKNMMLFKRQDVFVVNWLENKIVNKKGGISIYGFFKILIFFLVFRLFFRKFIFVRHNHYPHGCTKKSAQNAKFLVNLLELISHEVMIHSLPDVSGGQKYVPHPLYNKIEGVRPLNIGINNFVIFGRIIRYKKIEEVILSFPKHLKLTIAGKCEDELYLLELKELINNRKNIEIISDFLSDEQVKELILNSQGMLLTHNDNDMIVSGSFFYAMSILSKVYSLRTPFFSWAESELGNGYIEVFDELQQMLLSISSSGERFKNEFKKSPNELFGDDIVVEKLGEILG